MADLTPPKHLFFDLDDTLWDFETNSLAVLQELYAEFELEQKLCTDFERFYTAYKSINHTLWQRYYQRQIDKAFLRNHRFHLAFQQFNYNNYEENLLITAQYLARTPLGKALKEGCLDTLDYLRQRHTLHLITNGFSEVQAIKIDNCGLRSYFSALVVSEEHGFIKPDAQIFRLAESMAGARPRDCVMIGDNFECDVKGAQNAGWEAIHFSDTTMHGYKGRVIGHLQELKEIF
jgi:putative hydrolase of the HAD superfamily